MLCHGCLCQQDASEDDGACTPQQDDTQHVWAALNETDSCLEPASREDLKPLGYGDEYDSTGMNANLRDGWDTLNSSTDHNLEEQTRRTPAPQRPAFVDQVMTCIIAKRSKLPPPMAAAQRKCRLKETRKRTRRWVSKFNQYRKVLQKQRARRAKKALAASKRKAAAKPGRGRSGRGRGRGRGKGRDSAGRAAKGAAMVSSRARKPAQSKHKNKVAAQSVASSSVAPAPAQSVASSSVAPAPEEPVAFDNPTLAHGVLATRLAGKRVKRSAALLAAMPATASEALAEAATASCTTTSALSLQPMLPKFSNELRSIVACLPEELHPNCVATGKFSYSKHSPDGQSVVQMLVRDHAYYVSKAVNKPGEHYTVNWDGDPLGCWGIVRAEMGWA